MKFEHKKCYGISYSGILTGYEKSIAVQGTVNSQNEIVLIEKALFHDGFDENLDTASACEKILAQERGFIKKSIEDRIPIVIDEPLDISQAKHDALGLRPIDRFLIGSPPLASYLGVLTARAHSAVGQEEPIFENYLYETYPDGILRLRFILEQAIQNGKSIQDWQSYLENFPRISPENTRCWSGKIISSQNKWVPDDSKIDNTTSKGQRTLRESKWLAGLLDELRMVPCKDGIHLNSNYLDAMICTITGLVYSTSLDGSDLALPEGYRIPREWPKQIIVMS